MNTPARRQASAAHHARLRASGARKVTVWLQPEGQAQLARLRLTYGSQDAAVAAALEALK